jgi:OmpA-OmpF porin, OOP family
MLGKRWLIIPLASLSLFTAPLSTMAQTDEDEEVLPASAAHKVSKPAAQPDPSPGNQAPTISGLSGLFRTVTSDIGGPHTFRVGFHTEAFKSSTFLVENDENTRFIGTLAVSYTPIRFLEFFLNMRSSANNNDRPSEDGRLDQPLILALGDIAFGAKGQYPIVPAFALGANIGLTLLNSVGGVSFDGDSTSFYGGMYSTFDLDPLASFPLRFHLNLGYQLDNSGNLASFKNYPLRSLIVEKFALGVNPSQFQLKFGTDLPLRRWIGFGLTPVIELAANFATGDADPDIDVAKEGKPVGNIDPALFDGGTTMYMTIGVRSNPVSGFIVELATDIGMVSPGFSYGSPVTPWNFILGLAYAYDPNPPTKVMEREVIKTVVKEVAAKPEGGKLHGRVINAQTLEPVEGAIVTLPGKDFTGLSTDPDGSFITYELPAGKHPLVIRHPNYEPAKISVDIKAKAMAAQDIKLTPAAPKLGKITGKVADQKGKPIEASIAISGPENKQINADSSGAFSVELKPGNYILSATATGYLRKEQIVTLAQGVDLPVEFSLSLKPKQALVRLTKNAIVITKQVHFGTGNATILPDSQQLLDSIVDTLLSNPGIKKIEIAGHTDNRGSVETNNQLSQARAEAVKDYLVKNGVAEDRVAAKGYGPSKPKVPNITPRNRAQNRRVEFNILEQ